eukprot:444230_1
MTLIIKTANYAEDFLIGKVWSEKEISRSAYEHIKKDVFVPDNYSGDMKEYRNSLATSFLYKFFAFVNNEMPKREMFGFSLRPHLVTSLVGYTFGDLPNAFRPDGIPAQVRVQWANEFAGVVLEMEEDGTKLEGYAHISRLSDTFIESFEVPKKFPVGSDVRCRVISLDRMDGIALVTMKKSVIDQKIIRLSDVQPSMKVQARILKIESFGLLCTLTPSLKEKARHIRAVVPNSHMAETRVTKPHLKFDVGQMLTCRVLEVDPAERRVYLTLKETLVKSELGLIDSFEPEVGTITHGFVSKPADYGVYVTFYNGVFGVVPLKDIERAGYTEHPTKIFPKGAVLKVRVSAVKSFNDKKRIALSLNTKKKTGDVDNPEDVISLGQTFTATVKSIGEKDVTVSFKVKVPDTKETSSKPRRVTVTASLPHAHLTDHPAHGRALAQLLKPGARLRVAALRKDLVGVVVTAKPALLEALKRGELPEKFEQFKVGDVLTGYVTQIRSFGVFVRFRGQLTALAHKSALSARFVSDCAKLFSDGQTV